MLSKKKNILILTSTFPRWEGDTDPPFVYELCKRLRINYLVHVLCPHAQGTKLKEVFNGIAVERFRYFFKRSQILAYEGGILNRLKSNSWRYAIVPFFIIGELVATVRLLSNMKIDLINAHWLIPQGLVAVLAKAILKSSVPVVCTLHGSDVYSFNGSFLNALKRFILSRTSEVIVVSSALQNKICSICPDLNNVHIVPMGVDIETIFIPPADNVRKRSLLFVGKLVESKGLKYLIEALPEVFQKHPEANLTVVGNGPEESYYKSLVLNLKLNEKVKFCGAVNNDKLPEIYQSSQIVVFPSVGMEGFGLVMVEAMGCECVVVASDIPAVHDIIIDNQTGIIVEQKNVSQIAGKIIFLLDNPGIRNSLGKMGRKYVLERYDWKITGKKYCDLFEETTC